MKSPEVVKLRFKSNDYLDFLFTNGIVLAACQVVPDATRVATGWRHGRNLSIWGQRLAKRLALSSIARRPGLADVRPDR